MRLSYIKALSTAILLLCGTVMQSQAQEQELETLKALGFENIRVLREGSQSYIALQDDVYMGVNRGLQQIISRLSEVDSTRVYNILLQQEGIPKIAVYSSASGGLSSSFDTQELVDKLEGVEKHNSSFGKLDIMLYPELFLENSWLDKWYGVAVNFSPAAELSLWPGAELTAQVVIPLYTNMLDEKQYIRAGVIAFRQSLRLSNQLYGEVAVGNFTSDRMGVDAAVNYYTKDGSWNFGARAGLTGSSTFYGGNWVVSTWQRVTWSGWASYYVSRYDLALKGEVVQMTYGDRGVRGTMQRYFKDVSIGLYAMSTGGYTNGGFTFSSPLIGNRRGKRDRAVRVSYPEYFNRTYRAINGREGLQGYSYETRPDAGSFGGFYNPQHIEKYINNFKF